MARSRDPRFRPGRRSVPLARRIATAGWLAVAVAAPMSAPQAGDDALLEAGDRAREAGADADAIGLYNRAAAEDHVAPARAATIRAKLSEAHRAVGSYDLAVAEATAAIALDPTAAEAYAARGRAYAKKGLYEKAVADYDAAIARKPDFALAFNDRGRAYFYQGRFAAAAADFEARLRIPPRHVFPMLWLYLARARMGADGAAELAAATAGQDGKHWINSVVSLYLGRAGPEAVLAAAADPDPRERREKEAEAFFYIGQYYLLKGERETAARYFRATMDTGLKSFYEYTGAQVELQRMGLGG